MHPYIEYLPKIYSEIKEFKAIGTAADKQMLALQKRWEQLWENRYIDTADAPTLKRLQEIFGLEYNPNMSLAEQRNQIRARKQIRFIINLQRIRNMVNEIAHGDAEVTIDYDALTLLVKLELTSKQTFRDVEELLKDTVPANLVLRVALRYNRWSQLLPFTWGELQAKTWKQVKEDVL